MVLNLLPHCMQTLSAYEVPTVDQRYEKENLLLLFTIQVLELRRRQILASLGSHEFHSQFIQKYNHSQNTTNC
jgi:hypothetical protein